MNRLFKFFALFSLVGFSLTPMRPRNPWLEFYQVPPVALIINQYRFVPPGPVVVATDNFDSYSNNSGLNGQGNWVTVGGTAQWACYNPTGIAGAAYPYNVYGTMIALRKDVPTSANQYASITLASFGNSDDYRGPAVRCQSGADTCYYLLCGCPGNNNVYMGINLAGVDIDFTTTAKSYSTGTKLRLEATGTGSATRLSWYEDTGSGWVAVVTGYDPGVGNYIDGGQCGIIGDRTGSAGLQTLNRVDDFEVGNL